MRQHLAAGGARTSPARSLLKRGWRRLRGGSLSPAQAALSVFVGTLIGCQPLYGLHLVLCVLVCVPARLDTMLAYLAANISNPFVAPFLIAAELQVGSLLLEGHWVPFSLAEAKARGVGGVATQTLVGALVLGTLLALVLGAATYGIAHLFLRRRAASARVSTEEPDALEGALQRTVDRYAAAPRGDRYYVAMKLHSDPATAQLAGLGPFGHVTDAGCGRGQFGLLLRELGQTESLYGFDWDERKAKVAALAAGDAARFEAGALETAIWPRADTVLFMDVLHYVPLAEQRAALASAAASLVVGGRLLVRELNKRRGLLSWLTRAFERIASCTGYNRAKQLTFRAREALIADLVQLGLSVSTLPDAEGGLENDLIVATKPARAETVDAQERDPETS